MEPFEHLIELIWQAVESLITAFLGGLLGVLISKPVITRWMEWRWGGWAVDVTRGGKTLARELLTPEEARMVVSPEGSRRRKSVHLKGVISGIGHQVGLDPACDRAHEVGLTVIDRTSRRVRIDLDRDPGSNRFQPEVGETTPGNDSPTPSPPPTEARPEPPAEIAVEATGPNR